MIEYPPLSPNLQQVVLTGLYGALFVTELIGGDVSSPEQFALSYQQDPTMFYLLARGLSVLSSLLTLIMLYYLVSKLRNYRIAVLSVIFLAFCFLDVRHSHFVEPYSLISLMAVITAYAVIQYLSTDKLVWLAVGGIVCGIGVGLRFSVAPLLMGPLLAVGLQFFQNHRTALRIRPLLVSATLLFLSFMFGLLIGTPSLVLNTRNSISSAATQIALAATAEGFWGFSFTYWSTWRFYGTILEIAWGVPVILAIALGFFCVVKRHDVKDFVILAFPLAYGVVLLSASAASSSFARYLVPILPFLALLGADGVTVFMHWVSKYLSANIEAIVLVFFTIILIALPASRIIRLDYLWTRTDTRTLAKEWIEQHISIDSRIAIQWHGPSLATREDPEPNSRVTYQDVVLLNPFSNDSEFYSLQYFQTQGFDYLVLSSYIFELHRVDFSEEVSRRSFYDNLDHETELVAEFSPFESKELPGFFFEEIWGPINSLWQRERPGPIVKIYRLLP